MRAQVVVLVFALGFAVWMLSEFVRVGSSNMPTVADRLLLGLVAVAPLLLVAAAAAIAIVLRGMARLPVVGTGLLVAGLLLGVLWAFAVGLASG
jgi:hypothetical protein